MSLDRLMDIANRKVLIVGTTPIALAAEGIFAEAGATVQALQIAPAEDAMSEAVADFVSQNGTIDILVYAATRIGTFALPTMTVAQWDTIHHTNLRGAFWHAGRLFR